jgi:hypothetical protein
MGNTTYNVRFMAERDKAKTWVDALPKQHYSDLKDEFVLGTFDWRDWGFKTKPSNAFLNEVDEQLTLWETT